MTSAAIVADIEHETAAEITRLLAEADAQASAIVAVARDEVRGRVGASCAREEPAARLAAARRVNVARLRLLERRADEAARRSEAVFADAGRRLATIAEGSDPDRWRAALIRLVDEAIDLAGPGATISVRDVDLPPVAGQIAARGCTAAPLGDPDDVGVRAVGTGGSVEVDATLAARLARARLRMADAVAGVLVPEP